MVAQLVVTSLDVTKAFTAVTTTPVGSTRMSTASHALTERQMQFWEDVEDGLKDIEGFYSKQGENIDRIWQFTKSAQGKVEAPKGYAEGHDPSEEHVDGLTAKPFWDVLDEPEEYFPWAKNLEENFGIIQKEFDAKLKRDEQLFSSDSAWQNQVMGKGWSAIRLQRLGVWNVENCKEFPETYELLRSLSIPFAVRGVCFARQSPGSGVQPHSDGRNFILTSHLGVKIPKDCWMEVGGERRGWEEGKLTTIDTSFTHSTGNPTEEDRHVLIIDYWHPELTQAETAALEFVYDLRNKFESGLVPFRQPRSLQAQEAGGLGGWWKSVTGGGNDDDE